MCEINIALPILLVNRKSDIFIKIPIFYDLIDKRKPTAGVGWMEFIMSEVMERQAFRSEVVLKLLDTHNATVDELISSAKKIGHYVFQEHLTYYVANKIDREMLDSIAKGFIEGRERAFRQSEPSV